MRKTIVCVLLILPVFAFSQWNKAKLLDFFNQADSVVLVSHLADNIPSRNEKSGKFIRAKELVEHYKVNSFLINGRVVLQQADKDTLAGLLTLPNTDSIVAVGKCFMPHHAILIFKGSKCFFCNICFGCLRMETSREIETTALMLTTWHRLALFFKQRHLSYDLPEDYTAIKP